MLEIPENWHAAYINNLSDCSLDHTSTHQCWASNTRDGLRCPGHGLVLISLALRFHIFEVLGVALQFLVPCLVYLPRCSAPEWKPQMPETGSVLVAGEGCTAFGYSRVTRPADPAGAAADWEDEQQWCCRRVWCLCWDPERPAAKTVTSLAPTQMRKSIHIHLNIT